MTYFFSLNKTCGMKIDNFKSVKTENTTKLSLKLGITHINSDSEN